MAPDTSPPPDNCCTAVQLLFSFEKPLEKRTAVYEKDMVDHVQTVTTQVAREMQLELLPESMQCSGGAVVRCLGLLNGRGYISVYHVQSPQSNQREDSMSPNPLYMIDFYLPSQSLLGESETLSTTAIQGKVDRLTNYMTSLGTKHGVLSAPLWHQAERGFRYTMDEDKGGNTYELDLAWVVDMPNLHMEQNRFYKQYVAHVDTKFQQMDLYDCYDLRFNKYETVAPCTGSHADCNPDGVEQPDRIVYFDSIMQSRKRGLEAYHEALVHPLLLAHPNPRRVAIFGGGEGATLREVLKHNTVDECVMIEIDEEITQAAQDYLQDWNDCSDLLSPHTSEDKEQQLGGDQSGTYQSCFDDPRATVYYEDAIGWFIQRFFNKTNIPEEEKFDVIILDSL